MPSHVTASARAIAALVFAFALASPALAQEAQPPATTTVALHLKDGTVLVGEVLSEQGGKIRVRTHALGDITIDAGDVDHRGPSEGAHATTAVHAAEAAAPPAHTKVPSWIRAITASAAWVSPPFTQGSLSTDLPELTGAALRLPGAQLTAQLAVSLRHTSPDDSISLSGTVAYVDTEPIGRVSEAVATDFEYSRVMTPRTYIVSSTTFRRDVVRNIDNSFAELAGVGFKVVQRPRLRFDVVVGGALLRESKGTKYDNRFEPQAGVMEAFVFQISPRASVSHRVVYRAGLRESEVWNLESYTGVQAAITSRLSLVSGLTWNHDNVLGEAVTPVPANALYPGSPPMSLYASRERHQQITSGVQFTF
jgi:hypothetical protein